MKTDLTDYSVLNYKPAYKIHLKYKDGGISIIEQIVCSHARYVINLFIKYDIHLLPRSNANTWYELMFNVFKIRQTTLFNKNE